MRILKENCAAVIIDIQDKLAPHIFKNEELIDNCRRLIEGLKALEVPLIITEQYRKGLGVTIPEISNLIADFSSIEKVAFSCCDEPNFMTALNKTEKKYVVLFGIETHVCVLQTALDLISKGFIPVVIANCVSSRKIEDKEIAIKRLRMDGAIITSYESILFELCRFAGTDQFKAISRIVK